MVNYYIYAKDFSLSTRGVDFYHINGLKTLEQFKSDVKKIKDKLSKTGETTMESRIIYLHWGHECVEVKENKVVHTYHIRQAAGTRTLPETIIKWLQENIDIGIDNNKIKLIYIITDGLIRERSLHTCLKLNENMYYENVVFHALHQDKDQIDLSVAASFLKGRCTIYHNYDLLDNTDISEDFDYNKINVENFETEKNELMSYIKLKYINTVKSNKKALEEIEKLKILRDRLFKEVSVSPQCKPDLYTTDKNNFIQEFKNTSWYKNLNSTSQDIKVDIEKSISTLINYIISEKKSYAFDALKFDTNFKEDIDEEPIIDVDFTAEQEIEFPDIILDDEKGVPVILLTELNLLEKIIFHSTSASGEVSPASFSKFNSAMECPLFLLNDADISESIGYFYTVNVYKQLLEQTTKTEPRTRKPFHGGLVLLDTDEFDKYNDYILSATYFNFKKVKYNIGLFYFVLWKNCEKKEWMDKNVIEQFKKYVIRRISTTVCKIGLSSLPLDPQESTSLVTALWYCVEISSDIFKHDPQNFMHERLRMFYGIAHAMIEILIHFNYSLDLESIEKRRDVIRHVMILKIIPTHRDKVYFLLEKIFKSINGFLVSEIENPKNLKKLNYLKFNHKDMLCDNIIEGKVHLNDFVHLLYVEVKGNTITLCEKTYRPFFMIDHNNSFYSPLCKNYRKVVIGNDDDEDKIKMNYEEIDSLEFDKVLSLYNLFINCVKDSAKFPTFLEYIEYILRKKKFKDDLVTIFPSHCLSVCAKNVFSKYQNIISDVDVDLFIKVCKQYVSRIKRVKVEGVRKFNSDDEINKFLYNEEAKVNLKERKTE